MRMGKLLSGLHAAESGRTYRTAKIAEAALLAAAISAAPFMSFALPAQAAEASAGAETAAAASEVTIRVCNWEEYIDLGDWDEDEVIDLESGNVFGENSMVDDFEEWYYDTYGIRVKVEYSTFGTNEDLYNMLTLGDVYDIVCPSEYMIMKLMSEDRLVPLSDAFFDETDENNYYIKGVSPYIRNMFETHDINGETWDKYAAGYMWGITGIVYNPDEVTEEEASTWTILHNPKFRRRITIKDNVRDTYFAAVGSMKSELLTSEEFCSDPDYENRLMEEMNDVSPETIDQIQDYLQQVKDNVYSFETDSGKADMITGKVVANYQWSGDAVYTMDQAEEDDYYLNFAVPVESTDIYFDGWVMLKCGVEGDAAKQHACEAFINFCSRPDNAVRNMYYIGYTSVISGGDDPTILEYIDWTFGAEEDEEDTVEHNVGYFFTGSFDDPENENYSITAPAEQVNRQLGAQYPSADSIARSCIMVYFDADASTRINQMWINVRCCNINNVPLPLLILVLAGLAAGIGFLVVQKRKNA